MASEILSKCTLLDRKGNKVDNEVLNRADKIALYFSGHFCAPCRSFTPMLKEFYEEVNEDEKKLEIIFVSLDKSKAAQEEYHSVDQGNWPRIAFEDEAARLELKALMGVEKIPALVILDQSKLSAQFVDGVNDVKNMGPMALDMKWTAC